MEILHDLNKLSEWLFLCQRYVLPLYLVPDVCWFLAASTVVDLHCIDPRWANNQAESLRMKNDNSCGISGQEPLYIILQPPDIRSPYRDSLTTLPVEVRARRDQHCFVKWRYALQRGSKHNVSIFQWNVQCIKQNRSSSWKDIHSLQLTYHRYPIRTIIFKTCLTGATVRS